MAILAWLTLAVIDNKEKRDAYYRSAMKIISSCMFLLYPSVGGKIFSMFQCIYVGDSLYFVKSMDMRSETTE